MRNFAAVESRLGDGRLQSPRMDCGRPVDGAGAIGETSAVMLLCSNRQSRGDVMSKKKPRAASKRKSAVKGKAAPGPRGKYLGHYGWAPDVPDHRDFVLAAAPVTALPPSVDLRPSCPPVYDQGQLGSCTANAIAASIQFERAKQGLKPDFVPSRLFIYYNERVIEGTVNSDSGAMIRDGI